MRAAVVLVALAAVFLAPQPSGAQGKGTSLREAIGKCTAVRSMFDRLKCFDQLARDVRDFDEAVAEACACKDDAPAATAALPQTPFPAAGTQGSGARPPAGAAARPGTAGSSGASGTSAAAAARGVGPGGLPRLDTGTGKWKQVPRYRDDGLMIAVKIELIADSEIRGQAQKLMRPILVFNCTDKGTEAWMETSFTGPGDDTPVTMQFDDTEPYILRWANTTDGRYMGIWTFGEELAKKAMDFDRMKITFKPDGASPTSTTFDLRGLTNAAKPLRQLCIW